MRNDAIIFDIDGTLWNACPISAKGWNNGLKELGIKKEITTQDIERVTGHPYKECIEILFPEFYQRFPELFGTLEEHEIAAIKMEGGVFFDGVVTGVKKLAEFHRLFIISNCQEWYLRILLDRSGFEDLIEGYDCNGMSNLPKGEMITRMKERYSLGNPVYIGDTVSDEVAATAAGIEFIHVAYGFGFPKGAPKSFGAFPDLVDYFLGRGASKPRCLAK